MHKIFDPKQYSLADIIRVIILLFSFYTLFITKDTSGFIKILGVLFVSFVFRFRRSIAIQPSRQADFWEFYGASFVLANTFIFSFNGFDHSVFSILDLPMHFAGGMLVALWATLAFQKELTKTTSLKNGILILGSVALLSLAWELFEWLGDYFEAWTSFIKAQKSLNDTMGDFLFNFLGGIVVYAVYTIKGFR